MNPVLVHLQKLRCKLGNIASLWKLETGDGGFGAVFEFVDGGAVEVDVFGVGVGVQGDVEVGHSLHADLATGEDTGRGIDEVACSGGSLGSGVVTGGHVDLLLYR